MNQNLDYQINIATELSSLKEQVSKFLLISENDFLKIVSNLSDYQNFSNMVNENAKIVIGIIENDILIAGMGKLSNLFGIIGTHFKEVSVTIEKDKLGLQNIYYKLSKIEESFSGFDKIVKTLRMLGIATKIESAQLNLMDGGFFLLESFE